MMVLDSSVINVNTKVLQNSILNHTWHPSIDENDSWLHLGKKHLWAKYILGKYILGKYILGKYILGKYILGKYIPINLDLLF